MLNLPAVIVTFALWALTWNLSILSEMKQFRNLLYGVGALWVARSFALVLGVKWAVVNYIGSAGMAAFFGAMIGAALYCLWPKHKRTVRRYLAGVVASGVTMTGLLLAAIIATLPVGSVIDPLALITPFVGALVLFGLVFWMYRQLGAPTPESEQV